MNALRIQCVGLSGDDVAAMRSLLGLMAAHVKRPWKLVDAADQADVALINADAMALEAYRGAAQVVGCAAKPSLRPGATMHRPLRGYELLAVVNGAKIERAAVKRRDAEIPAEGTVDRYRLKVWPLEFERWPRDWWTVMSSITRGAFSSAEIVERTGLARTTVDVCLARLSRHGHVDLRQEQQVPVVRATPQRGWQRLAAKVGQVLGFSR